MDAPTHTALDELPHEEVRRHEVLGIIALAATALSTLALLSYDATGGDDWIGLIGRFVASSLVAAFGFAAWIVPLELGLLAVRLFGRRAGLLGLATLASTVVIVLVGCALAHLGLQGQLAFGGHLAGGVLGEVLGEVMRSLVGSVGAYVVGVSVLLVTMLLRTPISLMHLGEQGLHALRGALERVAAGGTAVAEAWREAREIEAAEREAERLASEPTIVDGNTPPKRTRKTRARSTQDEDSLDGDEAATVADVDACDDSSVGGEAYDERETDEEALELDADDQADETTDDAGSSETTDDAAHAAPKIVPPDRTPHRRATILDEQQAATSSGTALAPSPTRSGQRPFDLPPTDLLDEPPATSVRVDADTLRANAVRLTEKLAAYGVRGRVDEIHPGPVVTMYEFEPQSGTKISKIAGLGDDLAMALAAQKVRIVAPIPGKARVGFELPNDLRQTVYLREILEDESWRKTSAALPVALGHDIAGRPIHGDLAKMPHLLVAGATGAGKSVGINVMLVSLLAKKTPEEVRMLMIDPKVVELAVFDGIPHMLLPVVTDMNKAALALRWAVDEMERRYQLFADAGARNITTYNKRVEKVLRGELAIEKLMPKRAGKVRAQNAAGEEVLLPPDGDERPDALDKPPEKLPYVVVVVDEFADLMMVAAKDVESAIARLAQKARAAGIHVILATQRPSVDVITGMIKANFPARMAFKVSQREDSKTILGRNGAEHLLGFGDMLLLPPGSSDLQRVHGAYISEDEVRDVCDFLREQGKPVYDEDILKPREEAGEIDGGSSDDPLYDRAVAAVAQAGYCSISHVQRQLSVGYNKAAKLVEQMEKEGVVGPPSGKAGGRREVLIQAI